MSGGNDVLSKLDLWKQERQEEAEKLTPRDLLKLEAEVAAEEAGRLAKKVELGDKISLALSGRTLSPAHKLAISEAKLGIKQSPEHIAARVAPRLGRPLTEEHRRHCSEARLGWNPSEETRARMSAAKKGKPGRKLTPEDIARLNASRQTPEWREKIRVANTGQKRSPETREKIRLAKLGKKLGPRVKVALSQ